MAMLLIMTIAVAVPVAILLLLRQRAARWGADAERVRREHGWLLEGGPGEFTLRSEGSALRWTLEVAPSGPQHNRTRVMRWSGGLSDAPPTRLVLLPSSGGPLPAGVTPDSMAGRVFLQVLFGGEAPSAGGLSPVDAPGPFTAFAEDPQAGAALLEGAFGRALTAQAPAVPLILALSTDRLLIGTAKHSDIGLAERVALLGEALARTLTSDP